MNGPIQAKPTSYRGRQCKSRLEARWAVFLDYHFLVNVWEYEPKTFRVPETGWEYVPDFIVKVGPFQFFLEVKPAIPTKDYIKELLMILPVLGKPLILAVGDFYGNELPRLADLNEVFERVLRDEPGNVEPISLDQTLWFPNPSDAIRTAKTFRFDLPHGIPPHKKGDFQSSQSFIDHWLPKERFGKVAQEEAKKKPKRKRPIHRKRK